ncbi:unnamed protein product [Rhizoctonia solani]|uniref:Uncharacterized protein n=1 Tax=Rhizoctonia solani TaxID=456999 RepID=A0A8H3AXZ9_9AGAM|nr:unnamed protein product [Rhizoctonia solani]CAE6520949.1 unnamed protein product [Rhizoctonia solani]
MSVLVPSIPSVGPSVTLESLQVLERLGGSAGYLEHLQNGPSISGRELSKSVNTAEWATTICEVKLGTNPIWAWAEMHTLDGHTARLEGWGWTEATSSCGVFFCPDWDELTRAPVKFQAICGECGEGGRLEIFFWRDIELLGMYVGRESSQPRVHFEGNCTWKSEVTSDV